MSNMPLESWSGTPRPYKPHAGTKKRPRAVQEAMERDAARQHAKSRPDRIPVPLTLASPHPMVESMLACFADAKPDADGLIRAEGRNAVAVSPAAGERAMLILDTLLKAIEARGWAVRLDPSRSPPMRVQIGGEEVAFYLEELVETRRHVPTAAEQRKQAESPFFRMPQYDRVPSGRLHLGIHECCAGRGHWSDTARWRVEECLDLCIEAMKKTAEAQPRIRVDKEQAKRDREPPVPQARPHASTEAEQDTARELPDERTLLRILDGHLERLRRADLIQGYVSRMEQAARTADAAKAIAPWLAWVKQYAEHLNPCKPDAVLKEISLYPTAVQGAQSI